MKRQLWIFGVASIASRGLLAAVPILRSPRNIVAKHCLGETVVVSSLGIADFGLRLLKLRLAQLNDGTQPQLVSRLCQVERQIRLIQQLLRDGQPAVCGACVEPAGSYITRNSVAHVAQTLVSGLRPEVCFAGSGTVKKPVEYWNFNVCSYRPIPVAESRCVREGQRRVTRGNISNGSESANRGKQQITFGGLELSCRLIFVAQSEQFRTTRERLRNKIVNIPRWSHERGRVFHDLKILQVRKTQHRCQRSIRGILVVLRVQQKQLRLRQVNVCEAQVELRFQLAVE